MTTHTHKGTCQACGRTQAVDNKTGNIAKHGYTKGDGYFFGTCSGSDRKPLQVSRLHTDDHIEHCKMMSEQLSAKTIDDIKLVYVVVKSKFDKVKKAMDASDYAQYEAANICVATFEQKQQMELRIMHRHSEELAKIAVNLAQMADRILGTDLFENKESTARIAEDFQRAGAAYQRAEELKIDGWKPRVTRCRYTGKVTLTATKAA